MAELYGWKYDHSGDIPVDIAVDVTEGQVGKITAADTGAVAGAGDTPAGVYFETIDVSEGRTRTQLMTKGFAMCKVAAAVAINEPVMVAASGTVTPVTANNDIMVGRATHAQSTVGGWVQVDLSQLGTYYGA